jgi:hypothetical protein
VFIRNKYNDDQLGLVQVAIVLVVRVVVSQADQLSAADHELVALRLREHVDALGGDGPLAQLVSTHRDRYEGSRARLQSKRAMYLFFIFGK